MNYEFRMKIVDWGKRKGNRDLDLGMAIYDPNN
jgi:hypothetical protein